MSRSDAANVLNVSTRTVAAAAKVRSDAPEAIVRAVEQGTMSVSLAVPAVVLPEPEQPA